MWYLTKLRLIRICRVMSGGCSLILRLEVCFAPLLTKSNEAVYEDEDELGKVRTTKGD